ncbi:MAG TPA: YceI family protein [Candidatus Binatia bacterium]|nr:YceI family protein [Candidatus Binatia bacterium]
MAHAAPPATARAGAVIRVLAVTFLLPFAAAAAEPAAAPAAAGTRSVVASKSEIGFAVKQMGVPVTGTFKRFSGKVRLDPAKPETGSAELDVEIASIATGNEEADTTALTAPWLDAAGFAKATFRSTQVKGLGADRYEVRGQLTVRGQAREIRVPLTLKANADHTAVATGEFGIRRSDFGVGGGEWNEGDLVANEVPVHFRLALSAPK